jgi:hypothetical protein
VGSSLRLSPPKLAGAKPWARAPALNVTETNAVASAKKSGGLRTRARYAGNHKPWQAFFSIKIIGGWSVTRPPFFGVRVNHATPFQSSGEYSDPNPGGGPNIWSRSIYARFRRRGAGSSPSGATMAVRPEGKRRINRPSGVIPVTRLRTK